MSTIEQDDGFLEIKSPTYFHGLFKSARYILNDLEGCKQVQNVGTDQMSEPIECVEHQREEEDSLQSNQWTCGFVST